MASVPITVLMSVYNGERWLAESIQSVLDQSFSNFEFIIVDDGSSDDTPLILSQFSQRDSRICILAKPNTGLADSLNYGIANSNGKWIARIDADDTCEPTRLEKQLALAESDSRLVLVGSGLVIIDEFGNEYRQYRYPSKHDRLVRRLASHGAFFAHSSALFKSAALASKHTYRPRTHSAEDHDLWLRLSEMGKISCVNEPLVKVRKHSAQMSHEESGNRQIVNSYVATMAYWLRRFEIEDPVDSYSDLEFDQFRTWVSGCLAKNRVFETAKFLSKAAIQGSEVDGIANKIASLPRAILGSPEIFCRWANQRIFGTNLPKKMAKRWRQFT